MTINVVIRTEINPSVASGHAMRCMALAAALSARGASTIRLVCEGDPVIAGLAAARGVDYVRLAAGRLPVDADDAAMVAGLNPDLVVLDSPKLTQGWIDAFAGTGIPLAYLAGTAGPAPLKGADLCVWPELCPGHTDHGGTFRCGLDMVLLGPDYWHAVPRKRDGVVRQVLITTGGADHHDLCALSLRALGSVFDDKLEISVVIGAFFENVEVIRRAARESQHAVNLVERPVGLNSLLREADVAISGGGGTLYEMARLGVPGIGIAIWPIQSPTVEAMASQGTIAGLTWESGKVTGAVLADALCHLKGHPEELRAMSERGPGVIDGLGALRIVDELLRVSKIRDKVTGAHG